MRPSTYAAALLALLPSCVIAGTSRHEQQLGQWRRLADEDAKLDEATREGEPFANAPHLERDELVAEVIARNPRIDAARDAWRAALAQFPQMTALADPMASYSFAPLSTPGLVGAGAVPFGQEVMLEQMLPFPGKLDLRGAVALAEADAMRGDLDMARLMLAQMASMLHADYFANGRAIAVNEEHKALLTAIRGTLQGRFENGEETLQGPLGAEMELAMLERDRVSLESERDVLVAQMNELLHRPPRAPLPPAPDALAITPAADTATDALVDEAVAKRPELASLRARTKAAESEIEMAKAESWPDFSVRASYNSMWTDVEHQFMVGGSVDIPLQLGRRAAAVEQAEANRRRQDAELRAQIDAIRTEVESARRRLFEAQAIARSYDERTLPLAQSIVDAAQTGVQTNKTSFLELLEAERALRTAKLERATALARVQQQLAALERAVGRIPDAPRTAEETQPSQSEDEDRP